MATLVVRIVFKSTFSFAKMYVKTFIKPCYNVNLFAIRQI